MVVGELTRPAQVLVIGGGPGGYTAAARVAELGLEVILVEQGVLGGTCLNVGCIPSKALISVAHDVERSRGLTRFGAQPAGPIDMAGVQAWKQQVVDTLRAGVGNILAKVEVVRGTARLLDPHRVAVEADSGVSHFRFDHVILATGSRPVCLPALPVDGVRVFDSTGALGFSAIPETLAVVGGGYVGIELGIAYAKLGAAVTVVEAEQTLLSGFDRDLTAAVAATLDRLGVQVHFGATATGLTDSALAIATDQGDTEVPAERVLVAVGRRPNTDDLQLELAGLGPTESGLLSVDAEQRTAVRHIFAIGDITPGPALAHKAAAQGRVAAEIIAGLPSGFDQLVPVIAFTDPEIASIGTAEGDARHRGIEVTIGRAPFSTSGRALTLDAPSGIVKLVADAESHIVIGAQIAGPGACDLIGEAVVVVESALRLEDVVGTIHPHPTLVESIAVAAQAALRRLERNPTDNRGPSRQEKEAT